MPAYVYRPTEHFMSRLEKIRHHDQEGYGRIMKVVGRLLEHPDDSDGRMHGRHRVKFKKYVGRGDYRILYYYCELCRKAEHRLREECRSCSSLPDNSVIFFDVFHKNEKERLHY
jgi:hypothetical protein